MSKEEGDEKGHFPPKFNDIVYDYLGEVVEYMEEYIDLIEYASLAEELSEFVNYKNGLHSGDEMFFETERLKRIFDVLKRTLTYEKIIQDKAEEYDYLEDHEYGQYQYILPHSIKEYLKLADETHSSLVSEEYIKRIAEGDCLILFVRCRDNRNSFAIEIHVDEEVLEEMGDKEIFQV